jgi:hypothetical protein
MGKKRDTEFKKLKRRARLAERKVEKLKSLILLTDLAVWDVEMNPLSIRQWEAFIEEFKDEA